jgi:hypothetical protein
MPSELAYYVVFQPRRPPAQDQAFRDWVVSLAEVDLRVA